MAQASSARSEGHGNVAARNAQDSSATRHDPDDGAYPSSESDAEMDDGAHSKESRPLFADDENAEQPQDEREATQPTTANGHAHSNSPQQGPRRRTPLKWTEYIWVTFTLLLIAILGYSSQLCIILPYYHKTPSFSPQTLAALLIPFNVGLLGIFYNYYLCVFTDPGSVPSGWQPDWSALDPVAPTLPAHTETDPSLELKETIYRPRYCKTCSSYKPPRSHHCKTCQRCVLRMDHHCPWLANCVGHYNYAHFIRFLFWVDVTCLYHIIMISCRVLDRFNSYTYWREPSVREVVWLVVNYALCIPVILLVGIFSGYHFYCTAINQTTIESWEKDRTATMIRRGRIRKIKYPYNLGFMRNVRSVMGDNVLTWCLPRAAGEQRGDGLKYPVAPGLGKYRGKKWYSLRSHKSRHWRVQTRTQDQGATDVMTEKLDPAQLSEAQRKAEAEAEEDDESYVDPKLEASVLHRLRWENWHRQQARWRHQAHANARSPQIKI